jgi:hypothetical protein
MARLVIVTSLFVLSLLVRWFHLYNSCVLRGALHFESVINGYINKLEEKKEKGEIEHVLYS